MKRPLITAIAVVCVGLALWGLRVLSPLPSAPSETLRLAISPQIMSALVYVAESKGFFRSEGLEVTLEEHEWGKDALASVIAGKADVATVAEVPVMRAVLNGSQPTVFSNIQATDHDVTVIARKASSIQSPADLVGKRVGLVRGTNHEYFLNLFLTANGIDPTKITVVPISLKTGADELIAGRIDALASWAGARVAVATAMPDGIVSFNADGLYTELWVLAAMPEFLKARSKAVRMLLRALIQAEQFTREHRQEAIAIVARNIKMDDAQVNSIWDQFGFSINLDQTLLVQLEGEARFVTKEPGGRLPDFLRHISVDDLRAVAPNRVTIIVP